MSHISQRVRQRDADSLAKGYSRKFRAVEWAAIVTYVLLLTGLVLKVAPVTGRFPWLVVAAACLGYLGADFVSGLVHWMGDTWGSVDTPLLGKALIRPFREHHVDQTAITRHDFVETNGANCLISIPPLVIAILMPFGPGANQGLRLFTAVFIGSLVLWVLATNQFHKWAHETDERRPKLVTWMQRLHLVLPPAHHAIHHAAPFAKYYCITVGWLNWPLLKIGFFPGMERAITALTGALPRRDDIGVVAALEAAPVIEESSDETAGAVQPAPPG